MPQPLNMSGANRRPTTRRQPLAVDDAGGQAVADVRGDGAHQALVGIERQREEPLLLDPEVAVEPPLERAAAATGACASPRAHHPGDSSAMSCCAAYQ